jgi:hypothetical protein
LRHGGGHARLTNTAKTTVWRWQEHCTNEGVARLLRDRPTRRAFRRSATKSNRPVVARTLVTPPGETTPYGRRHGQANRHQRPSVQRIWRKHELRYLMTVLRAHGSLSRRATPRQRLRHTGHAYPQQLGNLTNPLAVILIPDGLKVL